MPLKSHKIRRHWAHILSCCPPAKPSRSPPHLAETLQVPQSPLGLTGPFRLLSLQPLFGRPPGHASPYEPRPLGRQRPQRRWIGSAIKLSSWVNWFLLGPGVVEDAILNPPPSVFCVPHSLAPRVTSVGTSTVVGELARQVEGWDIRSTLAWAPTLSGTNCDFCLFGTCVRGSEQAHSLPLGHEGLIRYADEKALWGSENVRRGPV